MLSVRGGIAAFLTALLLALTLTAFPRVAAAGSPTGAFQACAGGAVPAVRGGCVCPAGTVTYREGNGAIRCLAQSPETCIGDGQVVNGKCVCAPGDEAYGEGGGVVRCFAPPPETCVGDGQVVNGKCVCAPGDDAYSEGGGVVRCFKPAAEICTGSAQLVDGTCVCPPGQSIYSDANGVISCVPADPANNALRLYRLLKH